MIETLKKSNDQIRRHGIDEISFEKSLKTQLLCENTALKFKINQQWVIYSTVKLKHFCNDYKFSLVFEKSLIILPVLLALITISQIDMRVQAVPLSSSLLNAISNTKRSTSIENLHDNNTLLKLQQQQQQLFAMLTGNGQPMKDVISLKRSFASGESNSERYQSNQRFSIPKSVTRLKEADRKKKTLSISILPTLNIENPGFISDEGSKQHDQPDVPLNFENAMNNRMNGSLNGNMCPKECQCLNNFFDCGKKHLTHVPSLPSYVKHLDLVGNKLTDISVLEIKNLSKLQQLILQRNQLENLPTFQGLENLKLLDLSHNQIQIISMDALLLLPNLNTLELTRNFIHTIEANYFPPTNNLTHLILNSNRISKVNENAFTFLGELSDLQMNNNNLNILPAGTFQNLTKLKKLSLNNNFLELNYKTFNGLTSLKKLYLKSNRIRSLPAGVFFKMQSIESIELDNNFITALSREELFNITKLNHLSLSNNSISHIDSDTWEFTPSLVFLDLSHNNISEFKAQHLDGLEHLERLNLGHNQIQYLMDNSFDRVKKLEDLNLRRNKLAWIIEDPHSAPFKSLNKLKKLNLYGNNIKQITNKSLTGLNNLDTLNLGGNALASIEMNAFKHMKKLKKLIFKSLNFICDCNLLWFKRWLNENFPDNTQIRKNAICGYPEDLFDQEFLSLIDTEIICSKTPKPSLKKEPSDQVTVIGANVTFNCTAYSPAAASLAAADELKIIWRHDVHYMKPHPFYKIVQDNGINHGSTNYITTETQNNHDQGKNHTVIRSFLKLFNVSNENAGKYQCIVSNAFGTTYSNEFELSVAVLPKFLDSPSNVTVDAGDTVRLVCSTIGVPINQIVLQKSGDAGFPAAMDRRLRREENAFVITNAQPIDTGIYTCIANSDVGEIKLNTSLVVKDTPKPTIPFIQKETAIGEVTVLECLNEITLEMDGPRRDWFKDNKPFHTSKTSSSGRYYFTQDHEILVIVNTSSVDAGQYYCEISDRTKSYIMKTELIVVKENVNSGVILFGGLIILIVCIVVGSLIIWLIHCYQKRKAIRDERRIFVMESNNSNHLSASQHILGSSSSNRGSGFLDQTQLTTLQRTYLRQSRNCNQRPRSLADIDYKNISSFDDNLNEPSHSRLVITATPDYRNRCRGNYTLQYVPSRFNQDLDQQQDRLSSKDSGTGSDTAAKRSLEDFSVLLMHSSSPTTTMGKSHHSGKHRERGSLAEEDVQNNEDDNFLEYAPTRALGISEYNHDLSYIENINLNENVLYEAKSPPNIHSNINKMEDAIKSDEDNKDLKEEKPIISPKMYKGKIAIDKSKDPMASIDI